MIMRYVRGEVDVRSLRFSVLLILLSVVLLSAAQAATILVTTNADNVGLPPPGSLRAALITSVSGDVINFSCGSPCTITLAGALPPITKSLTIDGGSFGTVFVDGAGGFPGFFVDTGTVRIANLQVQNAIAQGGAGGGGGGGGGLGAGGCVFVNQASAAVTLVNDFFLNCRAIGGVGDLNGGLANGGHTGGGGGGLFFAGGANAGNGGGGGGGALAVGGGASVTQGGNGGNGGGGGGGGQQRDPRRHRGGSIRDRYRWSQRRRLGR